MKTKKPQTKITWRVPVDLLATLRILAEEEERSVNAQAIVALTQWLKATNSENAQQWKDPSHV